MARLLFFGLLWLSVGSANGDWEQVASNIAWSADGNRPGHFTFPRDMCATEIKLVHKSGYVSCNGNGNSNYGCEAGPHIAVHITMSNDALFSLKGWYGTIAPAPDDPTIHSLHSQGWWMKDGYNSASPQLVLDLPKNRNAEKTYCFVKNNDYYIWYSEDYSNTEGADTADVTAMEQRLEAKIEQLTQKLKDQEAAHQEE
eukprot:gene25223-16981_t